MPMERAQATDTLKRHRYEIAAAQAKAKQAHEELIRENDRVLDQHDHGLEGESKFGWLKSDFFCRIE
jgi:hypothetical protein